MSEVKDGDQILEVLKGGTCMQQFLFEVDVVMKFWIIEIIFDQVSFNYPSRPEEQVLKVYLCYYRIKLAHLCLI